MICQATEDDLDDMVMLLHQLFSIEKDFEFDGPRQKRGLELLLKSTSSVIMVAEKNQAVIGMGTAQIVISTAEGGPVLLVEDVVVTPPWQHQGIGTKLLRALGDWGTIRGARRLQLLADQNNYSGLNFYHGRGWQQTQLICLRKFHSERTNHEYYSD